MCEACDCDLDETTDLYFPIRQPKVLNVCWMVCGGSISEPDHYKYCERNPRMIELDLSLKLHSAFSDFYCTPTDSTYRKLIKAMLKWREFQGESKEVKGAESNQALR